MQFFSKSRNVCFSHPHVTNYICSHCTMCYIVRKKKCSSLFWYKAILVWFSQFIMTVVRNEATLSEKRRPGTGSSPKTAGSQSVKQPCYIVRKKKCSSLFWYKAILVWFSQFIMTVVRNEATLSEKRRPGTGSSPKTAGSQSVKQPHRDWLIKCYLKRKSTIYTYTFILYY